jgi:hypothetical protein
MPISLETEGERKATKELQDMHVELGNIQAKVAKMDRKVRAPKIGAKLGEFNPAIVCLKHPLKSLGKPLILTLYSIRTAAIHNKVL